MKAFLDECCQISNSASVSRIEIQLAWSQWCSENGHLTGSSADFGRKLRAMVPKIGDEYRRDSTGRDRWYLGLKLNSSDNGV